MKYGITVVSNTGSFTVGFYPDEKEDFPKIDYKRGFEDLNIKQMINKTDYYGKKNKKFQLG